MCSYLLCCRYVVSRRVLVCTGVVHPIRDGGNTVTPKNPTPLGSSMMLHGLLHDPAYI